MKVTRNKILIGIFAVIFLWFSSAYLINSYTNDRGTFGDMFGAINALFSGLALFGIIVSILIQQNELNLQREELAETRAEHKVNRLTIMLFKQLEYLNSFLDSLNYYVPEINNRKSETVHLSKFVYTLDQLEKGNQNKTIQSLIELNSNVIANAVSRINKALDNLDQTLEDTDLEEKKIKRMKLMFRNNLNLFLFPLLSHKINSDKSIKKDGKQLDEIDKSIMAIEYNQMLRIFNYPKKP